MAKKTVGYIVTYNGRPMELDEKSGLFKYYAGRSLDMFGPDKRAYLRNAVARTKRSEIIRQWGAAIGTYRIRPVVAR